MSETITRLAHLSLIRAVGEQFQIYELLPTMEAWGGWPYYVVQSNSLKWFLVPKNNPGIANWYNREPLYYTPLLEQIALVPSGKAEALAMLWMRGGKEFEESINV